MQKAKRLHMLFVVEELRVDAQELGIHVRCLRHVLHFVAAQRSTHKTAYTHAARMLSSSVLQQRDAASN